ncbi:uncharacterized protein FOMMEDRAFT_140630 [Fomitiporia mediterranea MF3/22]|uniref:uncharacterized protein n=1 Tax=Fomitiporia mediterranea (strain MF3/22) TaxID=694068 RepID=UPI00044083A4|nr:uncharacterized protein FOMMEDRAFT_140630 [Fomitiporia mediterranea MF3/22]EJD02752.1 hypothetical protein FOMMEDRAFT_140630 [Fomitiporia mediterranea MF3/22]
MPPKSVIDRSNVPATRRIIAHRPAESIVHFPSTSWSPEPSSYTSDFSVRAFFTFACRVWSVKRRWRTIQKLREFKDDLQSICDNGHQGEFREIVKETFTEIMAVLEENRKKMKELAERAKADAEERGQNRQS